MTKAVVLDNFEQLNAGIAYEVGGKVTGEMPFDLTAQDVLPVYREFNGWSGSISVCKNFEELPENFKDYCKFVEDFLAVKIVLISNGTGREQIIVA
jgi:adenylosuccinate synthase